MNDEVNLFVCHTAQKSWERSTCFNILRFNATLLAQLLWCIIMLYMTVVSY